MHKNRGMFGPHERTARLNWDNQQKVEIEKPQLKALKVHTTNSA